MHQATGAPVKFAKADLTGEGKPQCRFITPLPSHGWSEPVISEWELRGESWIDLHPHSEYAYVVDGHLFVESGGVTVEAHAGDVICVPGGTAGRYWAPVYARIIGIYGPSRGEPSQRLGYQRLPPRDNDGRQVFGSTSP